MVSYHYVQYQKKLMVQYWENLVTDEQTTDRQTDESDFIRSCQSNIKHTKKSALNNGWENIIFSEPSKARCRQISVVCSRYSCVILGVVRNSLRAASKKIPNLFVNSEKIGTMNNTQNSNFESIHEYKDLEIHLKMHVCL